jgi:acylphosphatase
VRTVRLQIKGRVQGVFFRATAREVARRLALSGWVRNAGDEMVEATVSGENEQVEAFVEWSRKGPQKARVKEVNILELEPQHFNSFEILR